MNTTEKGNKVKPVPEKKRSHSIVIREERELTNHERNVLRDALKKGQKISVSTFEIVKRNHDHYQQSTISPSSEITIWEK